MALDIDEVDVAASGTIYVAPLGTTCPTSIWGNLDPGLWVNVGYIGEDGITEAVNRENEEKYAWGGDKVRDIQTKHSWEFDFTMLQHNATTNALYYGDTSDVNATELPHKAWVIDWIDGDKMRRYVIPDAKITETGERTLATSEIAAYPVHLSAYPDAAGSKGKRYYDSDGVS